MSRLRKEDVALPQASPLPGQPTIQCALTIWHDAHGYGDIDAPGAVPVGAGWCPGVKPPSPSGEAVEEERDA